MNERSVGIWTLTFSATFHAWVFSGNAAHASRTASPPSPQVVEFTVSSPSPPPEPEPIPQEPDPPPQSVTPSEHRSLAKAQPSPVEHRTEVSGASSPELTGTTLTADLGLQFEVPPGSGRSRRGIFRAGVSIPVFEHVAKKPKTSPQNQKPSAPSYVPVTQLSRLPVPPELGRALEKNYPVSARQQGRSGQAKVRARVEPSGRIRTTRVTSESADGFGTACQKTLLESVWSAPLGPEGKPVATWVSYLCKFRIDR